MDSLKFDILLVEMKIWSKRYLSEYSNAEHWGFERLQFDPEELHTFLHRFLPFVGHIMMFHRNSDFYEVCSELKPELDFISLVFANNESCLENKLYAFYHTFEAICEILESHGI
jgi:hypothetical protein